MCGIAGICFTDPQREVDKGLLAAMTERLAHRGPDGSGFHIGPQIGLGHRRLSIIDLAGGDQPIYNEDGSIAIVFNGEIYNFKELRRELAAAGHHLATESDTEVIVHLYEDLGASCVDLLNGMFAFAIWDARRRRLLAARDRLGERPLYYWHDSERLLFASELKAILTDPTVPREIDPLALDDFFAYGYIAAPRTIFKGVRKLRAGERLVWEGGHTHTEKYWSPRFVADNLRSRSSWIEELRALLEDSVRLRLRSDVPVGAFLSGGLDSGGVVALASLQLGKPLQTFSVGFRDTDYSELDRARLTARHYHTDHHEILVRETEMSAFADLVRHFDEPFADPSMLPTYLIAREARRFVKVCLSGDAGDEVFAGYPHYREARAYSRFDALPPAVRTLFGSIAARVPDHVRGKGLARRLSAPPAVRYQRQIGVFDGEERRRLMRPELADAIDPGARLFTPYFNGSLLDPVSLAQLVDQNTYLPEDVLVKVDRAAMKNALEVRVPLLDHRIVELANSMPAALKLNRTTTKFILRKALAEVVPREVLTGPKRGFGIPIRHWFRGELESFANDHLLSPSSRSSTFLQRTAVKDLLDGHRRGRRDLSDRIWALLVFEEWCRSQVS